MYDKWASRHNCIIHAAYLLAMSRLNHYLPVPCGQRSQVLACIARCRARCRLLGYSYACLDVPTPSTVVYLCVCLCIGHDPDTAKTDEPIEMKYCLGWADSHAPKEPWFTWDAHWCHLASTMDQSVQRRQCGLWLPLLSQVVLNRVSLAVNGHFKWKHHFLALISCFFLSCKLILRRQNRSRHRSFNCGLYHILNIL